MPKVVKEKKTVASEYQKHKDRLSFRTKNGDDLGFVVSSFLKKYWSVIPAVGAVIGLSVAYPIHVSTVKSLNAKLSSVTKDAEASVAELKVAQDGLKPEIVKKVVEAKTSEAGSAGVELASAVTTLSYSYNGATMNSVSVEEVESAKNVINKYVSSSDVTYIMNEPWVFSSDWTLSFKSQASFEGDSQRVIFIMTSSDGRLMGVVTAVYDSKSQLFSDIIVTYTKDGQSVSPMRGAE